MHKPKDYLVKAAQWISFPPLLTSKQAFWLVLLISIYPVMVSAYIFTATIGDRGAKDFHSYWYSGLFVRQGTDPYQAYFENRNPDIPISYLDGYKSTTLPVAIPKLAITPANTAPLVLLLSLLSFFSWPVAKVIWMVINFILFIMLIYQTLGTFSFPGNPLGSIAQVLIGLVVYGISATRIAIENGQTTLIILMFILSSIALLDKFPILSGILFGLSLSKYSLGIGLLLFLLYRRKFTVIGIGLAVQLIGLLAVAWIGHNPVLAVIREYISMLIQHEDLNGVHITARFPDGSVYGIIAALLMTAVVFGVTLNLLPRLKSNHVSSQNIIDIHVLTIIMLWTLLVAYHSLYDAVIVLFFILLVINGLRLPELWNLSNLSKISLYLYLMIGLVLLTVPDKIVDIVIPGYHEAYLSIVTVILLGMLAWTLILFHRAVSFISQEDLANRVLPSIEKASF